MKTDQKLYAVDYCGGIALARRLPGSDQKYKPIGFIEVDGDKEYRRWYIDYYSLVGYIIPSSIFVREATEEDIEKAAMNAL